jgi:uncharacterized membrane protein YdjX (TVP38/TMEM64 family)
LLPLGIIGVALALFFALGGPDYVSIDSLRENRDALAALVTDNFLFVFLGFIGLYALLVGISFPGAGFLSIFGGFLFGTLTGAFGIVIGATIGATAIFLAARYALGDTLRAKAGPYMKKFEAGLKENELSYLFILRLVPLFPFFIVNIVPALFDVKIRNYVLSTAFGIIPGSLVYASVGAGIGAIFDAGEEVQLSGLMLQPKVIGPILGLIALSLVPILYKKFKGNAASA